MADGSPISAGPAIVAPGGAPDPTRDDAYRAFLEAKVVLADATGFDVAIEDLNPWLRPVAKVGVRWMLAGGRRAIFASFGLHKTSMQIEACHRVLKHLEAEDGIFAGRSAVAPGGAPDPLATARRGLIGMPLGVRQEFARDAASLGIPVRFVQTTLECWGPGLYLTNYESLREGKIELAGFDVVSLDEAACLRGMGGSKTFRVIATALEKVPYRFVATATPSPNEYIELLAYSEVLGIMDVGQAKTRFFRRNSEKADELTLHPHKEKEFWLWVASWALFITKPSDVGCSDDGYDLPEMEVVWHEVSAGTPDFDDPSAGGSGQQGMLFRSAKIGVATQAREKRATLLARVAKMAELCAAEPAAHRLLWHDLNDEAAMIREALPEAFVLEGAQPDEVKEQRILGFSDGLFQYLAAKPVMAGAGCNFQRHCDRAVFVGIGFKFHDFIQAIHRIYRFGQTGRVRIDIIFADSEREVRAALEAKWAQHKDMVAKMGEIIREFGLSSAAMADVLKRSMGVERVIAHSDHFPYESHADPAMNSAAPDWRNGRYWLAHNDCVDECRRMAENSVDLIVTSIPFGNQYEYSANFADFGHTDNSAHFFQQMDFLVPELFRVLKPGRNACIHVKDRITPGGINGLGFQTVYPFGDDVRAAFRKHGFAYLGRHDNVTDVVRENNQTYRLSYSEQLKDGTRMGAGISEEILIFRKPPSDLTDGYADVPVVKPRPAYAWVTEERFGEPVAYDRQLEKAHQIRPIPDSGGFSRGKWQLVASGLWKTSGNRLLDPQEWMEWTSEKFSAAYRLWKQFDLENVYDFQQHVLIAERFDYFGFLPSKYQLMGPHSDQAQVWTDISQMRSLNTTAAQRGVDKHLCPLPFDIPNRLIEQRSMPGELVFDPFAGVGTVPYCALKLGRRGAGVELSPVYWADAATNLAVAEESGRVLPTLFDAIEGGVCEAPQEIAA